MNSVFSTDDILNHPERLVEAMRAGLVVTVPDVGPTGYSVVPTTAVVWAGLEDDEELGEMVSLTRDDTGIHNTLFASTKGYASERHGQRIKIAVDPSTQFVAGGKSASMSIHSYGLTGEYVPPALVEQVKRFIELNREALLDYWEGRIATREFLQRIRPN
jgi:hypothetical protein